jgi:hypothetical protein
MARRVGLLRLEETMRPANRNRANDAPRRAAGGEHGPERPPLGSATPPAATGESEPRSSFGTLPGAELPAFVYVSVLAAFGWIMLASWLAFAGDTDADLALGVAVVLAIVIFALPIVIHHTAVAFCRPKPQTPREFLAAPVETATGPLSGASAWLQVLLIPLALALAATLIGVAHVLVR